MRLIQLHLIVSNMFQPQKKWTAPHAHPCYPSWKKNLRLSGLRAYRCNLTNQPAKFILNICFQKQTIQSTTGFFFITTWRTSILLLLFRLNGYTLYCALNFIIFRKHLKICIQFFVGLNEGHLYGEHSYDSSAWSVIRSHYHHFLQMENYFPFLLTGW